MIYLDHHSTTPLDPAVLEEMLPYMTERFGNPSSLDHAYGHDASVAVEEARERVAGLVGARHDEIVFTSGATESDNLALVGVARRHAGRGNHIVTCATEHKAVLDTAAYLENMGWRVTYLPVDRHGMVDMESLEDSVTSDTVLVSVMAANNEVGTIPDIGMIGEAAHRYGALFHTDAAQAAGHIPVDVEAMHIDLMSVSAHKMYGPKGAGALYVRSMRPAVRLDPILHGGGQEGNLRSGTLNVPAIVGLGKAAQIAGKVMAGEVRRHRRWAGRMMDRFAEAGGVLNGHPESRLAHNLNVRFPGVDGKAIINTVSDQLAISAGSACTTETVEPSHVLLAMGLDEERAHESVRLGLGRSTTQDETERAADIILDAVSAMPR